MEWALSIPRGQALAWLDEPWGTKETDHDSLADVREVCEYAKVGICVTIAERNNFVQ